MRNTLYSIVTVAMCTVISAQNYDQYMGHGGVSGVTVTTSSDLDRPGWEEYDAIGDHTIDGSGMEYAYMTMARLMKQATLGASAQDVWDAVPYVNDIEGWIDGQMAIAPTRMLPVVEDIFEETNTLILENGGDSTELYDMPQFNHFNYAWWAINTDNEDLLRHRMAYALSQILVISMDSDLWIHARGTADYYDILLTHAFGNYRDLLHAVSLHPTMGHYLSHLNNPRSIPQVNVTPDENYAREIMQLFSIGLYELNLDGSRRTDGDGHDIPTYDQTDITELAKVFTGLGLADVRPNMYFDEAEFGVDIFFGDLTQPMIMYEEWHEPGEKRILGGQLIPAGQTGMEDIEDAVDIIFNHPNVAPFVARRLIQHMVTSNPSPGYISRVARAFNDNGQGVRGDMGAVVKAILLDTEARDCDALQAPEHGKLIEPFIRYTSFARFTDKIDLNDNYWNAGFGFYQSTGQSPLYAQSVFNFFLPDHIPNGALGDAGRFGPEFQIHNARTAISYINEVNAQTVWQVLMNSWEEDDSAVLTDYTEILELAQDPETLINHLDRHLTHGQMTDETRTIIRDAISQIEFGNVRIDRARLATYLTLISPDYTILR